MALSQTIRARWVRAVITTSVILFWSLVPAPPADAHEVWLEPLSYRSEPGETLKADLKNGEGFSGVRLSYNTRTIVRLDVRDADGVRPVSGRLGDRPAVSVEGAAEGLVTLIHQSSVSSLTYRDWDKFTAFVAHKDFAGALARHRARGIDETGFVEAYARFAKALVAVGNGAGADAPTGLETEIVALANPYTDRRETIPVQVLYRGRPRPDVQVELFDRAPDGQVSITLHRTDADGRAVLPVTPGHTYLVDAVVLREPDATLADQRGAVWETLWAALTFAVPAP